MSSTPNSAVEAESVASNAAKPERMLAGFPWVSAIVLYTLSWGWSLLRPNTLYWDDWQVIYNKPKFYMWNYVRATGRPPWSDLVETQLIPFGNWTVRVLTFFLFFVSGICLFGILQRLLPRNISKINQIVLIFLILPVNHARVSIVIFDYTSSYFLFFFGWYLIVNFTTTKTDILGYLALFLSLKTHSFLFFSLLPFLHLALLSPIGSSDPDESCRRRPKLVVIPLLLLVYVVLRQFFWPPSDMWVNYQTPSVSGVIRWIPLISPFLFGLIWFVLNRRKQNAVDLNLILLWAGSGVTALALAPYFIGRHYQDYASVVAFRSDWGNRHQLLMPLGVALCVVGLSEWFRKNSKKVVFSLAITFSLIVNLFVGSNFYLDSLKKDQFISLLLSSDEFKLGSEIVIMDNTKHFNGRGSSYRDSEWSGLIKIAGLEVASVSGKRRCDERPDAEQLTLKSEINYLKALVTRDLGLYFEIKPCSEVLAQNN